MGMNVAQLIVDDYLQILEDKVDHSEETPLQVALSEKQKDVEVQEL